MKKCLVIGGAGFIGRHLTSTLAANGYDVSGLSRGPSFDRFESKFPWYFGDFSDPELINEALKGVDVVFHLASTTVPNTAENNIPLDIQNNIKASVSLMESCAKQQVQKFVFISSGGTVYGPDAEMPASESSPTNPISAYGVAKLSIEKYLYLYAHTYGLSSSVVRLSNPYGPGQDPRKTQGAIPIFIRKILNDDEIVIWGDGKIIRDYVYIDDVISALLRVATEDNMFSLYNIGSNRGYRLIEILQEVADVCQKSPFISFRPSRTFDVPCNILNTKHAYHALGWLPKIGLRQGIEMTYHGMTT